MLENEKIVYEVWLSMALHSCKKKLWECIAKYGGCKQIYEAFRSGTVSGFDSKELKRMKETELSQAYSIIDYCRKKGYEIITYYDDIYPESLRQIYNPPLVLYCYGRLEILRAPLKIAMVGARKASAYSVEVAREICRPLVANNCVIVSGFALGIDSVAHSTTLNSGGYSIAVIGCGLDYPYPKENFKYRDKFIKRGLIISEFIPQYLPESWCFPHRNRIISGLCRGTVVVEAGITSGSLVTADLALEQGRDVFCVPPHNIFDKRYGGNVKLLKSGAIPLFSYTDILEEYSVMDLSKIPLYNDDTDDGNEISEKEVAVLLNKTENENPVITEDYGNDIDENLDDKQKHIVLLLKKRDMLVDELSFESGLDTAELFLLLTELEIAGIVENKAGNIYGILK